jgi:endonuclease YncB( thermonuclease family)
MKRELTAVIALVLLTAVQVQADPMWWVRVVEVADGDTIMVQPRTSSDVITVGLFGVETPMQNKDFGEAALNFTNARLSGHEIAIDVKDSLPDPRGRTLAMVYYRDDSDPLNPIIKNLNQDLLKSGLAVLDDKSPANEAVLLDAQSQAKLTKVGLWSIEDPVRRQAMLSEWTTPAGAGPANKDNWFVVQDSAGSLQVVPENRIPRVIGGPFSDQLAAVANADKIQSGEIKLTTEVSPNKPLFTFSKEGKCSIVESPPTAGSPLKLADCGLPGEALKEGDKG